MLLFMLYTVRHQQGAISRKIFSREDIPRKLVLNAKWDRVLVLCKSCIIYVYLHYWVLIHVIFACGSIALDS